MVVLLYKVPVSEGRMDYRTDTATLTAGWLNDRLIHALHCITPHRTLLICLALHRIVMYCVTLHCTALAPPPPPPPSEMGYYLLFYCFTVFL